MGTALPSASSFFLNYILMHAIMINVFRFLWPHDGTVLFVLFRAVGLFRPKCERDVYMIRTAPSYRAGRHFGAFLLIQARGAGRRAGRAGRGGSTRACACAHWLAAPRLLTAHPPYTQVMALSYAVIAPLVLPSAIAYFFTAWVRMGGGPPSEAARACQLRSRQAAAEDGLPAPAATPSNRTLLQLAWRYCALYFYERSYEAAGRIFETLFACMVRLALGAGDGVAWGREGQSMPCLAGDAQPAWRGGVWRSPLALAHARWPPRRPPNSRALCPLHCAPRCGPWSSSRSSQP